MTVVEDMDQAEPRSNPTIQLRPKPDRRQSGSTEVLKQGGRRKTDRIADDVGQSTDATPQSE
jgi:hypothetical protein